MAEKECVHDFHYYPSCAEDGWKCVGCGYRPGEVPGYSPELDVFELERKVGGLLMDLHEADLLYVSNGTAGDGMTGEVVAACREAGKYDQTFILRTLFGLDQGNEEFWKKRGDAIRAGEDPYDRCACGKIATILSFSNGAKTQRCSFDCPDCPEEEPF